MKLCKDCKHLGGMNENVCIRTVKRFSINPDYVHGLTETSLCRFAQDEREDITGCGPDAKYFVSKVE